MSSKADVCLETIIRLSLGAFLITTAVLKLISIDSFELYIYSFNIFSFVSTTIISRIVIAVVMWLGLWLLLKIFYRETWLLCMSMMLAFTIFLMFSSCVSLS